MILVFVKNFQIKNIIATKLKKRNNPKKKLIRFLKSISCENHPIKT